MLNNKAAALARRGYASAAAASVARTANGIHVATHPSSSSTHLASLSLVINGGARFESSDQAGAAHYLKAFGFRNTTSRTSFRTVREAELNGASLSASATREHITYTVQCFPDAVPYFVDVLADIATATKYSEHEFREVARMVHFEALGARQHAETRVLGGVHQAAFRMGLGNSLYAPEASPVASGDAVRRYAAEVVAADRVAVVATGVDAQQLARLIGDSALGSLPSKSSVTSPATQLTGGAHVVYESAAPLAHYALAFPCDTPQAVRPLAALLGASSRVKWGAGTEASLAHVASSKGFGVAPFAFAYSDAGLVGVVVSAARGQIGSAVRAVAESIQKHVAQPNDAQVGRAVAQASLDAAQQDATVAGQIEGLARAAFAHKQGGVLEAAHVKSLAKSVFSAGKPVAASVGLPQDTPYVDTLGF